MVPKVEGRGILAASWLSSKWPHRAPACRVLMRAFAGGARDPEALERSDEELVSRGDERARAAARHQRPAAADACLPVGARERSARSRPPGAHGRNRAARSPGTRGCSSPAAASVVSASPIASPTAARRPVRFQHWSAPRVGLQKRSGSSVRHPQMQQAVSAAAPVSDWHATCAGRWLERARRAHSPPRCRQRPAADQGRRQGSAGGLRRRRTIPPSDGGRRAARRRRSKSAERTATARSGSGSACGRPAGR